MDRRKDTVVRKNVFMQISLRHGLLLFVYIAAAFILNEILILGNDYIARAADDMFAGKEVDFSSFMLPLMIMVVLGTGITFVKSISGNAFGVKVQKDIRDFAGKQLIELPYSYFDDKGTGGIMTRLISDVGEAARFFSEILPELIINVIIVVTITVYLIRMDVFLIIVLFGSYPIMLLIADRLSRRLTALVKKKRAGIDERTQIAYDAIQGITVGRSYRLYDIMRNRINGAIDSVTAWTCKSTRISSAGWVMKGTITKIPVIFCYLFALRETLSGRITTGDMLAFTVLLGRILYPIGDFVFCIYDIREVAVSLGRIQEIFQMEKESSGTGIFPCDSEIAVAMENVEFAYDKENKVLSGLTFVVKKGESIAFVGSSGEGKSTIFRLLCGFYKKDAGKYLLFSQDYEKWNISAARSCISLVSQNVFLFPESIWQNVAYGKEGASREEVIQACKNANIHDFIMKLPDGYDTMVGERGVRLSGGERQRISIARAFLKDAPILLLDEPTASIDEETEKQIQKAIHKISDGRTVITIAHRLSTIRNADRIYVIDHGRVAEEGTHEELLEKNGIYGGLYGKKEA